jgi:hypothetical protein
MWWAVAAQAATGHPRPLVCKTIAHKSFRTNADGDPAEMEPVPKQLVAATRARQRGNTSMVHFKE